MDLPIYNIHTCISRINTKNQLEILILVSYFKLVIFGKSAFSIEVQQIHSQFKATILSYLVKVFIPQPKFSSNVAKAVLVFVPTTIEIYGTVFSSLKNLAV